MKSDLELLTAWRAGDEHAGELLVTRHYPAIERFFVNKARDHAADLIQRTFLVLLEVRERIDERGDVRRYLFGIARARGSGAGRGDVRAGSAFLRSFGRARTTTP